ncbi:F-box/LRR-repeat protein 15-like [Harmonia axyridis]|uniref:F-box/LRR-repeat protein 15-like n=1 Tax=Harmonia axyridis TaxID=115357 RepID=UPI001E27511E|nr:F-box/LRR-repeat protein 15-like [Harmonia axyridis]
MNQTNYLPYSQSLNSSVSSLFGNEFEKTVGGFNRLPQHILLKIFSHLKEKDLHTVQQVCQRWKQGALNPSLWKNLKIQKLRTTDSVNMALQKIWMFGQLEKVYIKDVIEASALLRQVYRCLPNLKYLIIRYCNNLSAQTMRAVLRKCKQLEMLDLKGTTFRDNSIFEELPRLPNLRILNLSDNGNLTTKDMIDISLNCRNLEEFYVSFIKSDSTSKQLTDEDCNFIVSNMSKNLKGFYIDGATLTDQCFQRIFLCHQLEHLGFHRAYNLTGKTFSVIWQYLTHLKTLKLTFGNQIRDEDVEVVFLDGRTEMSNLEVIDFTGCWKIKDNAVKAIAESCPKLKKLILKNCKNITDVSPLKKCKELAILNIAFCLKLSIDSWLPIQTSVHTIFIDHGDNLKKLEEDLRQNSRNIDVRLCHSQFKKSFEYYRIHQ